MSQHASSASVLIAGLLALAAPAIAQDKPISLSVELSDVSLHKLPFVMAAEAGIYRRNGLDVKQYIRRARRADPAQRRAHRAAEVRSSRPRRHQYRRREPDHRAHDHRCARAGADRAGDHRSHVRFHIMSRTDITRAEDLKGKRIGFGTWARSATSRC